MPPQPALNLIPTVQQAITNLLTTYEPEFLRFGYNLFLAFATILIAWQGICLMFSHDGLSEQLFDSGNHSRDDAFGVACPSSPKKLIVFAQWEEGWHRVHVCRERHDRLAPACKNVEALRLNRHTFDVAAVFRGERREMAEQKFSGHGFVVGHRLDINERARELKKIHDCFLEWNEREGKNRRKLGAVTPR